MADKWAEIQILCNECSGNGIRIDSTGTTQPCVRCGGDGVFTFGRVKIKDLDEKLDLILEKLGA